MKQFLSLVSVVLLAALPALAAFFPHINALAQETENPAKTTLPSIHISSIEITPWGILAGEMDSRAWLHPYNGLFYSEDLGRTWKQSGMVERGITDIKSSGDTIFVSTYYTVDGLSGLFISTDKGETFQHAGINFSASGVEAAEGTVYLGGYSHGLWVSFDNGVTWIQKIGNGTGWTGPTIVDLFAEKNTAIASITAAVYISKDYGNTWNEVQFLKGKQIKNFYIKDNIILAGAGNNEGLYRSLNGGETWERLPAWGSYPVSEITWFSGAFYATGSAQAGVNKVFISQDQGNTWIDTGISFNTYINTMKSLFSVPSFLYISANSSGVYKYEIPKNTIEKYQFLDIPWANQKDDELTGKITAFFDHEYPLLEYPQHPEPEINQTTTVNFYGAMEDEPKIYYSSHNGTDFRLSYGSEVRAAASGIARYYYCNACGYSIKIDHLNGYQTTYMHLQKTGLITQNATEGIPVDKNQVIGNVGLTGRTSGPHLHFSVMFDKNGNGIFDDYPDGLVDPYGWLADYTADPWPGLIWTDVSGRHSGSTSKYLWNTLINNNALYINDSSDEINAGSIKVNFSFDDLKNDKFTAFVLKYLEPDLPLPQASLEYIEGSALSITLLDHYENPDVSVDGSVKLTVDLTGFNLENVIKETLKMYVWNKISNLWEPIDSNFDESTNLLTAHTTHLSHFAVFGEKLYPNKPETTLLLDGENNYGWHNSYPTADFQVIDINGVGIARTLYSLNKGVDWLEYKDPFTVNTEGISTILFFSEDNAGNTEDINEQIIKVDTLGTHRGSIRIKNTQFKILENP